MNLDLVISLTSIYLALVSLLSSFFFINLTQWLNSIIGLKFKWGKIKLEPKLQSYDRRLECFAEAKQHASGWTRNTWIAITTFLVIIFIFQLTLILRQKPDDQTILIWYIMIPTMLFLFIYVIFSSIMLSKGYKTVEEIIKEYNNG